jgi:2-methylisocitrate lyase-like PEP mutase family enzyme
MMQEDKARIFETIHQNTFVLPNAWDAASARIFEEEQFRAIGTTSGGIAFSLGYPDGQHVPAGEMLEVVQRIAKAVTVPVSADVEAGYGNPIETAQKVWAAGAVGINIEDSTGGEETLVPTDQQAEVIRRIRKAVPALVVNARTDLFLIHPANEAGVLAEATERLQAYRQAGAQCLFAPGLKNPELIRQLAAALDAPLNILAGPGFPNVSELKGLGVKRISLGSGVMRACLGVITHIAKELQTSGTYQALTERQYPYAEANRLMEHRL